MPRSTVGQKGLRRFACATNGFCLETIVLKFTVNGKSIQSGDIEKELMRAVAASLAQEMRERLSAIRHPDTGEFAVVVSEGDTLEDMSFRVEGSAALLEIVKTRLSPKELESMTFISTDSGRTPQAFLSYGWEDRELAKKIAEGLHAKGINTWWAEWEIGAGDSIRRKIDEGLSACTHFIVLLTPSSITRQWVNEEIDAGFMRKVNAKSRFIPLRYGVTPNSLPPLMSGMLSPEVNADASNLQQLINDIHGVSRKPALGPAPSAVVAPKTGYSSAATAVAGLFVTTSKNGQFADLQLSVSEIMEQTGLSKDDVTDALHELRHRVKVIFDRVLPKDTLYAEFDQHWQTWDPADDALKLATDLMNDDQFPTAPSEIGSRYGWPARRLNPAMSHLRERDAVNMLETLASGPFICAQIRKTDSTRRFVKSRNV